MPRGSLLNAHLLLSITVVANVRSKPHDDAMGTIEIANATQPRLISVNADMIIFWDWTVGHAAQ